MTTKHIVAGLILFFVTLIQVQTAAATALGLAPGLYSIAIEVPTGPFPSTTTGTGIFIVGPSGITLFDATFPHFGFGGAFPTPAFDCFPCTPNQSTPDLVTINDSQNFAISDTSSGILFGRLNLFSGGSATLKIFTEPDEPCFATCAGSWQARAVAEPSPWFLLLTGIAALGGSTVIRRSTTGRS
jgi:hypothetical protein